jgi:hypothetical protein
MPRNDQVTRQWNLLRTLEASREGVTLPGLAEGLPAEFSRHPRTIRRDLEALEAAGFPLLTEKVDGRGVVWKLMEGFRNIPALAFSPTELMALTFSPGHTVTDAKPASCRDLGIVVLSSHFKELVDPKGGTKRGGSKDRYPGDDSNVAGRVSRNPGIL